MRRGNQGTSYVMFDYVIAKWLIPRNFITYFIVIIAPSTVTTYCLYYCSSCCLTIYCIFREKNSGCASQKYNNTNMVITCDFYNLLLIVLSMVSVSKFYWALVMIILCFLELFHYDRLTNASCSFSSNCCLDTSTCSSLITLSNIITDSWCSHLFSNVHVLLFLLYVSYLLWL